MTTPATAAPCLRCRTTGGYIPRGCSRPARPRQLCQKCYDRENKVGNIARWPLSEVHANHPTLPTGLITLASRGIRGDIPPIDPALTPAKVREIAHRNALAAFVWLVARGMAHDEARRVVDWQPAAVSTPDDGERRAA